MKISSKKMVIAAALLVGSVSVAALSQVGDLNKSLAKLADPYNHRNSKVDLVITKAEVNAERAVALQGKLLVKKVGQTAAGALKADIGYSYPTKAEAVPKFKLTAELAARNGNMSKILANLGIKEEAIRKMFEDTEKSMNDSASDILKRYGDAATVKVVVKHQTKDKKGDYRDLAVELDVKVDLSKLPVGVTPADVLFTAGKLDIDLDLDRGFSVKGTTLINKGYSGFRADQKGLKEYIEALLNQNKETMAQLSFLVQISDMLMEEAVGNKQGQAN